MFRGRNIDRLFVHNARRPVFDRLFDRFSARLIHMNTDQKITDFPEYDRYAAGYASMRVPLLWLMHNATESCDGYDLSTPDGWAEMIQNKSRDTGFGHLVDSMLTRGFIPEGSIGFLGGEITEGHHRLTAAILLGLDDVWISLWGGDPKGVNVNAHYSLDPFPIEVEV